MFGLVSRACLWKGDFFSDSYLLEILLHLELEINESLRHGLYYSLYDMEGTYMVIICHFSTRYTNAVNSHTVLLGMSKSLAFKAAQRIRDILSDSKI